MRRLVAILNPQADRGRTAALAESLQRALCGQLDLSLLTTTKRGEAVELARDAAQRGCDLVIAIGGDGTVHEVVNGLMTVPVDERPALGIIPAGSGNDVAYALGINQDLQESIDRIERNITRAIDVAAVRALPGRTCFCINNVGTLLEGQINLASHRLTWPRGSGLYIRALLQTLLRPLLAAELQLTVDGAVRSRRAIMLSLANGPRSGGKFRLIPDASIDDGQFDYILAAPVGRLRLLWKVSRALRGRRVEASWIEQGRFSNLTIRSNIPLVAHVDGEPWLRSEENVYELAVDVLPGALRVLCDSPCQRSSQA